MTDEINVKCGGNGTEAVRSGCDQHRIRNPAQPTAYFNMAVL